MNGGGWKTITKKPRPQVTDRTTWTGTYEAGFVAGGIKASDKTYRRSMSVGNFTTTRTIYDTGKVTFHTTRTNRRHEHYKQDGSVHTPSHVPTSGSTIEGPLRPGAKKTFTRL